MYEFDWLGIFSSCCAFVVCFEVGSTRAVQFASGGLMLFFMTPGVHHLIGCNHIG